MTEDIELTSPVISPASSSQNHAQYEPSVDSDYPGDIIHTSSIYRLGHSDTWACEDCKQKGDKWFMQQHLCSG
jgi:hypothetical protein